MALSRPSRADGHLCYSGNDVIDDEKRRAEPCVVVSGRLCVLIAEDDDLHVELLAGFRRDRPGTGVATDEAMDGAMLEPVNDVARLGRDADFALAGAHVGTEGRH